MPASEFAARCGHAYVGYRLSETTTAKCLRPARLPLPSDQRAWSPHAACSRTAAGQSSDTSIFYTVSSIRYIARPSEPFDQIRLFYRESRFPTHKAKEIMGNPQGD